MADAASERSPTCGMAALGLQKTLPVAPCGLDIVMAYVVAWDAAANLRESQNECGNAAAGFKVLRFP